MNRIDVLAEVSDARGTGLYGAFVVELEHDFYKQDDPALPGEPCVRIRKIGGRGPLIEYRASQILGHGKTGFRVPSNWADGPDEAAISGDDCEMLEQRIRSLIPYSEGRFALQWIPSDPRVPF